MKSFKNSFLFFLAIVAFQANAQLSGRITKMADSMWTLSNNSGTSLKIKFTKTGHFNVDISKLEKGIYSFGKVGEIFIQPNYKTEISVANNEYIINGNRKIENEVLKQTKTGLDKFLGNPGYAVNYAYLITEPSIFVSLLDEYVEDIISKSEQSPNTFFKNFIKQEAEFGKRHTLYAYQRFYGLDSSKMNALRTVLAIPIADRTESYRKDLMAAYQGQFSKKLSPEEKERLNKIIYEGWDVNNEILYKNSAYYKGLIGIKIDYLTYMPENTKRRDSLKNDDIVKLEKAKLLITNELIKEDFIFRYTKGAVTKAKAPADVKMIYESYINNSKSEKHKLDVKNSYQNLAATLANVLAPDFNYVNPKGEMVSLKSLRGKYVYIDVWATWCAPCIAEIPSLKKLEEEYKGKKIQFVSISVDVKENKNTWLSFVTKNNLQGIQLMADQDFNSNFIKKFGINSIPRFILINPDGVIVDNNAKRPSNNELVEQLNSFKL